MNAVIVADIHSGFPRELLARRPPALLPLAGSSVSEIMLARLARAHARRVVFVVSDTPYPLKRRLGHGERFGLDIRHVQRKAVSGLRQGLDKALPLLDDTFLVFDRLLITDVDIEAALAAHREAARGVTVCRPADVASAPPFFILDRSRVPDIPPGIADMAGWAATLPENAVHIHLAAGTSLAVDSLAAYLDAVAASLAGTSPFSEERGDIIIGRHCDVHPTTHLIPPVRIGDFTSIGRECVIGPMAQIGGHCVVDARTEVLRSVVMDGSYVGREVTLDGRVADHELLITPKTGAVIRVPDAFLLGDAAGGGLTERVWELLQRLLALAALAPACLVLLPILLVPAWRRRVVRREAAGEYVRRDLKGSPAPRRFHLYEMEVDNHFLRRLPALWDVAAGRLNLVGVEPMPPDEAEIWRYSWAEDRFKRPPGLVTPWRAMTDQEPESEEKRVMENYYVQTWSMTEDLRILVRGLFRLRGQ